MLLCLCSKNEPASVDQVLARGVTLLRSEHVTCSRVAPLLCKAPAADLAAKRARRNISEACAACRRSKVKCDELKPCRRCLRDGRRVACVPWRDGQSRWGNPEVNLALQELKLHPNFAALFILVHEIFLFQQMRTNI